MLNLYHFKRANYENCFIFIFKNKKYIFSSIHPYKNNDSIIFLTESTERNEILDNIINLMNKINISQLFRLVFNTDNYKRDNLIFNYQGDILYKFNLKNHFRTLKLKKIA